MPWTSTAKGLQPRSAVPDGDRARARPPAAKFLALAKGVQDLKSLATLHPNTKNERGGGLLNSAALAPLPPQGQFALAIRSQRRHLFGV